MSRDFDPFYDLKDSTWAPYEQEKKVESFKAKQKWSKISWHCPFKTHNLFTDSNVWKVLQIKSFFKLHKKFLNKTYWNIFTKYVLSKFRVLCAEHVVALSGWWGFILTPLTVQVRAISCDTVPLIAYRHKELVDSFSAWMWNQHEMYIVHWCFCQDCEYMERVPSQNANAMLHYVLKRSSIYKIYLLYEQARM